MTNMVPPWPRAGICRRWRRARKCAMTRSSTAPASEGEGGLAFSVWSPPWGGFQVEMHRGTGSRAKLVQETRGWFRRKPGSGRCRPARPRTPSRCLLRFAGVRCRFLGYNEFIYIMYIHRTCICIYIYTTYIAILCTYGWWL